MRNAGVFGLAGRRFKNGTAGKSSDRQNGFNFCTHIGNAFGQHTVYLGQRHRAFFHAQQLQDFQVLQRLGHDAVVCSYHQQGMVNAYGTGGHGVHKAFVAGHVNDAHDIAIGQRHIGVAQFNGDAACFFFFEAVGLHPGERANQGGLSVVDMSGGTNDHAITSRMCTAVMHGARDSGAYQALRKQAGPSWLRYRLVSVAFMKKSG